MDFLLGLWTGMVWWQLILLSLIISFSFLCMLNESGVAFTATIATAIGFTYFTTGITFNPMVTAVYFSVYLIIGILWSIFKWYKFVKEYIKENKAIYKNSKDLYTHLSYEKNYDTLWFWVIWWPGSILAYFLRDFVLDILQKLGGLYDYIAKKLVDSAFK